jgi:hypothetical protein
MKCKKGYKFVIVAGQHIEIRKPDGTFESSVCCKKCLPELEMAIRIFKKEIKRKEHKKL